MSTATELGTIRSETVIDGVERVHASSLKISFAPHRHDDFVVGMTSDGVQRFRYRGADRFALPGDAFVLHPDETHDGRPGTEHGYGYRAIYLAPWHIAAATGGCTLPFVGEAVSKDRRLVASVANLLDVRDTAQSDLLLVEALADLARVFQRLSGQVRRRSAPSSKTLGRIREALHDGWQTRLRMADLEAAYGIDRYVIARAFRRCFGVSPSRYVMMRRLDHAERLIASGEPLVDAALGSGFADQSHMTREFVRAFGVTPGRWRSLLRQGERPRTAPTRARLGSS